MKILVRFVYDTEITTLSGSILKFKKGETAVLHSEDYGSDAVLNKVVAALLSNGGAVPAGETGPIVRMR